MSRPSPAPPWRAAESTPPAPPGPAWRSPSPRAPYRPRWRKLALAAGLALAALAAVTWAVFWIRPPDPARLVVLSASYDRTLAVPPNPYGKHDAREMATLARPGSWLGTRSRLAGGPTSALTRSGLPDLSATREKCVVVFVAAHGGRDRDGPFLFPEDATGEPAERVRFKTLLDQFARLPADRQKLLVIDATHAPAFPDLGLVHNDFAAAVEELDAEIAAVPNLAVFLASGPDERSWCSPEWGRSSFVHFMMAGLGGAADADGNTRVTAAELVAFVTPRVSDWARDHRGARQVPVLLPKEDGTRRAGAMHLVSADGKLAEAAAPEPFEPPPELERLWQEYRALAGATPPPTAYTPHLWRQYEAWALRHEQLILADDSDGAKVARASAAELRRKIEAARPLDSSPQTLALPSAVGGRPYPDAPTDSLKADVARLAAATPPDRAKLWASARAAHDADPQAAKLLWCRALVEWAAGDPVNRLAAARELVPLVAEGLAVRPAELHFLLMLALHAPKPDAAGPLLAGALALRVTAERSALAAPDAGYPFAEVCEPWARPHADRGDIARRLAEDLCFATDEKDRARALELVKTAGTHYRDAQARTRAVREAVAAWYTAAHRLPALAEWVALGTDEPAERFDRDAAFRARLAAWRPAHQLADAGNAPPGEGAFPTGVAEEVSALDARLAAQSTQLLTVRPEVEGKPAARADAVKWLHAAGSVLTAPPADAVAPEARRDLARELRRVSRQLLVTGQTRPEPLPEVTAAQGRERAFDAARRRGLLLVARLGEAGFRTLAATRPGEGVPQVEFRLTRFAFQADGRQSLAEAGTRLGELLEVIPRVEGEPGATDRVLRVAPAGLGVTDEFHTRRRLDRVLALLARQAERTRADRWHSEAGPPYYRVAVERLRADARALAPDAPDAFARFLRPDDPFPVEPKLPERVAITDQPNPALRFGIAANPAPGVSGFPVFWTEPGVRTPVGTDPGDVTLVRTLARPPLPQPLTPKAQTQALRVAGFFRGQTLTRECPVDFYPVPDRAAVVAPLPPAVGLAVRADAITRARYGFGTGAVAVVLDCSGSMGRDPKNPASVARYPTAVEAFARLLGALPPGTTVTVFTFGQNTRGAKTAEETIHELLPPTALPPDTGPVVEDVLAKVRGLAPYHQSPVVRAVVRAKDRIKDAKVPFKAVVLISDAVDTRFAEDPDYGGKKRTVGDVLRAEFPPSGVALSVAAFEGNKDEEAAQAEFKSVEKFTPAGKFVTPDKVQELIDWLRLGLNARVRFTLEPLSPGVRRPGDLTAGTADADNWYAGTLDPGAYTLRVSGAPGFASDIVLSPGDRLLLDLTEDRGGLTLRRHWFADTAGAAAKAGTPEGPWRLGLLQNRAKAGRLELFAAIDGNPAATDARERSRVGDAWFEVTPAVPNAEPVAIRWRAEGGFPAPCWSLDSPGWPNFPGSAGAASPRMSAWWSREPFPAAGALTPAPGSGVLGMSGHAPTVGGVAVTLESVTIEEHEVEVAPGERHRRACLVARLTHPAGDPVFARPLGVTPTGREVRLYRGANQTTCLFWWPGLTEVSVKEKVSGLEFVVLNDATRAAEKAGRHLTLPAPAPTDASPRPDPPAKE